MTGVDKIKTVRQLRHVNKLSIKEIVRRICLFRNTVRKIIRSDATKFVYQRGQTHQPVTGPIEGMIKEWIEEDNRKRKKQRRTAWRMYEILKDEYGYKGSYESIAKSIREVKAETVIEAKEAFMPLIFEPGEAFQFEWGEIMAMYW